MVLGAKKHQTSVAEFVLSLQSVAIKIGQESGRGGEFLPSRRRGGGEILPSRRRGGGEINAKAVQNLGKFTNSPCLSAFLTLFFCEISEENGKGPLFVVLRPLSVTC